MSNSYSTAAAWRSPTLGPIAAVHRVAVSCPMLTHDPCGPLHDRRTVPTVAIGQLASSHGAPSLSSPDRQAFEVAVEEAFCARLAPLSAHNVPWSIHVSGEPGTAQLVVSAHVDSSALAALQLMQDLRASAGLLVSWGHAHHLHVPVTFRAPYGKDQRVTLQMHNLPPGVAVVGLTAAVLSAAATDYTAARVLSERSGRRYVAGGLVSDTACVVAEVCIPDHDPDFQGLPRSFVMDSHTVRIRIGSEAVPPSTPAAHAVPPRRTPRPHGPEHAAAPPPAQPPPPPPPPPPPRAAPAPPSQPQPDQPAPPLQRPGPHAAPGQPTLGPRAAPPAPSPCVAPPPPAPAPAPMPPQGPLPAPGRRLPARATPAAPAAPAPAPAPAAAPAPAPSPAPMPAAAPQSGPGFGPSTPYLPPFRRGGAAGAGYWPAHVLSSPDAFGSAQVNGCRRSARHAAPSPNTDAAAPPGPPGCPPPKGRKGRPPATDAMDVDTPQPAPPAPATAAYATWADSPFSDAFQALVREELFAPTEQEVQRVMDHCRAHAPSILSVAHPDVHVSRVGDLSASAVSAIRTACAAVNGAHGPAYDDDSDSSAPFLPMPPPGRSLPAKRQRGGSRKGGGGR